MEQIRDATEALKKRQSETDDESILPKVTLSDIPKGVVYLSPSSPFPLHLPTKWIPMECFDLG